MIQLLKITIAFFLIVTATFAQKSPRKDSKGMINNTEVTVDYGSPFVKERVIWGNLVPYNKVWRAGANENTTISFSKAVKINDTEVLAGKYGFFIIPTENEDWILILNKKNDSWGSSKYNKEEDYLRLKIHPKFVNDNQESLEFTVVKNGIEFAWEKARFLIPIE